jgi:hypothetical protein
MDLKKKISLPYALVAILGSTFLITGSIYSLTHFFKEKVNDKLKDKSFITKLIQTGPQRDALSSYYLQEVLDLSKDKPFYFEEFDAEIALQKLKQVPMIKEVKLTLYKPDTLYIDYTLRRPLFMMEDYENLAVDEEGYLFPFKPFYSPKQIPSLFLGETLSELCSFFKPIQSPSFEFAKQILKALEGPSFEQRFQITRIDLSHALEKSLGQKEVIIDIASESFSESYKEGFLYHLRVTPKNYLKELGNYLVLHKELFSTHMQQGEKQELDERIVDLRVEGVALVSEAKE